MSSPNDLLIYSLTSSRDMLLWFTADLTPAELLHRTVPGANCAAWLLGHLALTDRRILKTHLGATELPALPDGFEQRFTREGDAPKAGEFGDVTVLRDVFAAHRNLLIEATRTIDGPTLSRPLDPPHPRFKTVGEALAFMAIHVVMHAGQVSTIRRSLGRPPLV